MSTPCNSLNVQLIKVSQLANYTSLKNADELMLVENTGGSKYSRRTSLSSFRGYILDTGLSGFPSGVSYTTITDSNNLSSYNNGGTYTYTHNLGSTPSLTRVVLYCNSNDGNFLAGNEIDISSCYNESLKPLALVVTSISSIKVSLVSFSHAYAYNPTSPPSQISLNKLNWQIKIYAWK